MQKEGISSSSTFSKDLKFFSRMVSIFIAASL
jgi:hypothetical protein